jgi:shikimate kinase
MTQTEHQIDPAHSPNLYIIGFMGTGKSRISRRIAKKLGLQFYDVDEEIEKAQGKPIKEIFAEKGESYFRQLEREYIESGHPETGCIIACGGGLPCRKGMIELLKSRGIVLCLYASVDTILDRTARNDNRPLLNVENPREKIETLLAERTPYYAQAHTSILTDHRSIPEVVDSALRSYRTQIPHYFSQEAG